METFPREALQHRLECVFIEPTCAGAPLDGASVVIGSFGTSRVLRSSTGPVFHPVLSRSVTSTVSRCVVDSPGLYFWIPFDATRVSLHRRGALHDGAGALTQQRCDLHELAMGEQRLVFPQYWRATELTGSKPGSKPRNDAEPGPGPRMCGVCDKRELKRMPVGTWNGPRTSLRRTLDHICITTRPTRRAERRGLNVDEEHAILRAVSAAFKLSVPTASCRLSIFFLRPLAPSSISRTDKTGRCRLV
uniref:Uncharacterized protein n=1 Tax=Mycena chlorophos TaxID=658473 RepID=A0ABQ0LL89_MYCCL|nr:predicted protein [Mycena chlorophos]